MPGSRKEVAINERGKVLMEPKDRRYHGQMTLIK